MTVSLNKLFLVLAISLSVFVSNSVSAANCPSASTDTTVTSSCSTGITWTGGNLNIGSSTSAVTVTNPGYSNNTIYVTSPILGVLINTANSSITAEQQGIGILNHNSTIETLTNLGSINFELADGIVNSSSGVINTLNNLGTIDGGPSGTGIINGGGTIATLNNSGTITAGTGIYNNGSIATLHNSNTGTIVGGVNNTGGTITNLINAGTINGNNHSSISNVAAIGTITNTGSMYNSSGLADIFNNTSGLLGLRRMTIGTLNNQQGAGNDNGALKFSGVMPSYYNIIISSSSTYGRLIVPSGMSIYGTTTFGIYAGGVAGAAASTLSRGSYTSVLSGVAASNLTGATQGNYNGFAWSLSEADAVNGIWNLLVTGALTADTQSAIHDLALKLRSGFTSQAIATNFSNMNTYDCNLFDTKGMCISAGGRYTTVDNPNSNSTSAVVVLGYKATPNFRIGGFLDQNVSNNTPTGVRIANKNPMMGAFAVWNKNADGLGVQVKVANAYQDKDVSTTRDIIGTSEAGTGSTNLNTQSYVGELSYAFTYKDKTLLRPYLALRHTIIKQDAYTEATTALVTAPLTYAALEDRSTAALIGVKLNQALTSKATLTASLGIEQDLTHKVDQYTASGVSGLTSEKFNNNIKHTRPVASVGGYYAVSKTQRIAGDIYYQQLPFQSSGSTTAYFNYTIGF